MAEKVNVNAKWDECVDLTVRRFVYSSLGGAFTGLLFFRSPVTRWAAVAFGAGVGIGSAYSDCSRIFDGPLATLAPPPATQAPRSQLFYYVIVAIVLHDLHVRMRSVELCF